MHDILISKLDGYALAYAVAMVEGLEVVIVPPQYGNPHRTFIVKRGKVTNWHELYDPVNNWAQTGPLLDKHHIEFMAQIDGQVGAFAYRTGQSVAEGAAGQGKGSNRRLAALRAIVATKSHVTAQIPPELWQE